MYHRVILLFCLFFVLNCKNERDFIPPNIIFILADDFGYHDMGTTGSDYYQTPHLDSLAADAIQFTQGYASSRVCSPSRASIMTGKHTASHGITDWIGARYGEDWRGLKRHDKLLPPSYQTHLKKEWTTLPEALKNAGYTTFFAGKWHLGKDENGPLAHGFDFNVGGWDKGYPAGGYFSPWDNPFLENKMAGENLSMRLARETNQFIDTHGDNPFFAFLSFYAVHSPIQTTQEKWAKYQAKAEAMGIQDTGFVMERVLPIRIVQDNPIYGGLVEQMDAAVGLVMNKIKELGLDKNTIVVFTSDNGGVASGDAYSTSNLPLRGGKGYQWEGGIREPYFIKVPGQQAKDIGYPVTGADFYPTLLDLANVKLPGDYVIDGESLKPIIEGKKMEERALYWHYPHYGNQGGEPSSIIRRGEYKLIYYWEDGHSELYHLIDDPGEQRDLSEKLSERTEEMKSELLRYLKQKNVSLPQKDTLYNDNKHQEVMKYRKTELLESLEKQRLRFLSPDYQPNSTWWNSQPRQEE